MLRKKSTYFCCILILDIINKLLTRSPLGGVSETSNGMAETQFLDQKTASGKSAWNFA